MEKIFFKNIAITGKPDVWGIKINKEELFNETSTRCLYLLDRIGNNLGDRSLISDDDKNLFNRLLSLAISDLTTILARRLLDFSCCCEADYRAIKKEFGHHCMCLIEDGSIINNDKEIAFFLVMSENHDKNMLSVLANYCNEYLIQRILEQWLNIDLNSILTNGKIVHILQYRKHSPARKVRNFL